MTHLCEVYRELHDQGVFLFDQRIPMSDGKKQSAIFECCGTYGIYIDSELIQTLAEESVIMGHEAGHCMTGATHKVCSPFDLIQKHENRANRWAYKKLIPEDELNEAVSNGITEPWELAEYFDVTEDFIKKAVCYYTNENPELEFYY